MSEVESTPEAQEPAAQTVRETIAAALATNDEPREPAPEPEPLAAEDDAPPADDLEPSEEAELETEAADVEVADDEEVPGVEAPAHWCLT